MFCDEPASTEMPVDDVLPGVAVEEPRCPGSGSAVRCQCCRVLHYMKIEEKNIANIEEREPPDKEFFKIRSRFVRCCTLDVR